MVKMQVRQEDMLDPFLFFQRETGGQRAGIHHDFVIDEKADTATDTGSIGTLEE